MKNINLTFLCFVFVSIQAFTSFNYAQSFNWVKQAGGDSSASSSSISTDANGNSYVTGYFRGTATFGTIQLVSSGFEDIFMAKYDASGNCIWAKQAGGNSYDNGYGISTDTNGNSYVTGYFRSTATFGTIQLVSYGESDIFIAKYDTDGNCIWAKQAGGNSYDISYGISTDANGNSYVTGTFADTAIFGTIQLVSYGLNDIFIAKYDASGNCIWAKQAGGTHVENGVSISTDANGNSYVTGTFADTAIFGTIQLVSYGLNDIFIAKYDASGNCIWAKKAGGTSYDTGLGISTDANGNTYITGRFQLTATFGTIQLISYGDWDIFVAKYDASGNCIWAKKAGGTSEDFGYGISTDANGNSYVTGRFEGTAIFGSIQLVSYGFRDIFISKYDINGNCVWAINAGGNSFAVGLGISTDANGNTYVNGNFEGTATFGTMQLVSSGEEDIFIASIDNVSDLDDTFNFIPTDMQLHQNFPNPFNPSTKIKYSVPTMSNTIIKIFDILGNEIETLVNEEKQTGTYELTWYAAGLSSGVYFYRIQVYPVNGGARDFIQTRKMVLMK